MKSGKTEMNDGEAIVKERVGEMCTEDYERRIQLTLMKAPTPLPEGPPPMHLIPPRLDVSSVGLRAARLSRNEDA